MPVPYVVGAIWSVMNWATWLNSSQPFGTRRSCLNFAL